MKIYTKTGDGGKTSLFSGERVSKTSMRIEAYGDLDELNSIIGAVTAAMGKHESEQKAVLQQIQGLLLNIGAWLATTPGADSVRFLTSFPEDSIQLLESKIDQMNELLVPLRQFVLPGGHPSAALAHVARTVCRRTERRVIAMVEREDGPEDTSETMKEILIFLNRLSDYFFVLARYCNHLTKTLEVTWNG